jgi:hypothetical protein
MGRAEEYDRRAAEAEARAKQTRDPFVKRQWEELAAQWRVMAEQARTTGPISK